MKTRHMGYAHYGISTERSEELQKLAKLKENRELVQIAAEQSRPEIADGLIESLTKGISCRRVYQYTDWVPCTEDDFYGYKRRAIFIFDMLLKLQKLYETGKIPKQKGEPTL